MVAFFDSEFFVAIVTLIVGGFAIYLYYRQKSDKKQDAAIVLINEIRNAEDSLQTIKESIQVIRETGSFPEINILPTNNWNKVSNLFAKDLDQDEFRLIDKFYADSERVNYIVNQANNMFLIQVMNRASAIQHTNLNIIDRAGDIDNAIEQLKLFESKLWGKDVSNTPYLPQGFYDKLIKYLPEIQFVLSTTAGSKLKKIAK